MPFDTAQITEKQEAQDVRGVIAGRLDEPQFAAVARGFFNSMAGGPEKLGPTAPKRSYDWSKTKEQNLADAMAGVDAAFAGARV